VGYEAFGSHTYTKPGTYVVQMETIDYVLAGYGADKIYIGLFSRITVK
jgi:hypothetical protein